MLVCVCKQYPHNLRTDLIQLTDSLMGSTYICSYEHSHKHVPTDIMHYLYTFVCLCFKGSLKCMASQGHSGHEVMQQQYSTLSDRLL